LWIRAAYFISGVVLLFWLSVEDTTLQTPLMMATWVAGLFTLHLWVRFRTSPCQNIWRRYPLAGSLIGAFIPITAVLMTIFKSGLHAHGFFEFTIPQLANVLRLTVPLTITGLLLGMGISLWRRQVCKGRD
jgi:hypothetical protein